MELGDNTENDTIISKTPHELSSSSSSSSNGNNERISGKRKWALMKVVVVAVLITIVKLQLDTKDIRGASTTSIHETVPAWKKKTTNFSSSFATKRQTNVSTARNNNPPVKSNNNSHSQDENKITFAKQQINVSMAQNNPSESNNNTTSNGSYSSQEENKTTFLKQPTITAQNHPSNHTTSPHYNQSRPVTIVVQLSGELGNQVHKIASGFCLQHMIETRLGLTTELKLQTQARPKWKRAMKWTKAMFPNIRPLHFREANTEEFQQIHKLQNQWINEKITKGKFNLTGIQEPNVLKSLPHICQNDTNCFNHDLMEMLRQAWILAEAESSNIPRHGNFSFPHVYSNKFLPMEGQANCLDWIGPKLREFFTLDVKSNCKELPHADETVFHFRNFIAEMPKKGKSHPFREASPNQTALEIFANHQPGDKVAIISRSKKHVDLYVDALTKLKGLNVRYIEGQTGNQDFCFLAKAQKEIIGVHKSTFVLWAGILGDAKKVRLYALHPYPPNLLVPYQHASLNDKFSLEQYYIPSNRKSKIKLERIRRQQK